MTRSVGQVTIVGGGLAGSEAAAALAAQGVPVLLCEMRPVRATPAHRTGDLAELVCSNSLGSRELGTGKGLLLEELRRLGSLVVAAAERHAVPAGSSLAVDREGFAREVTAALAARPSITLQRREVVHLPDDGPVLIATGPLTSEALSDRLAGITGRRHLAFYDAIAPIVTAESLDRQALFAASRWGRGPPDFLNAPLDRPAYEAFVEALLAADTAQAKDFDPVPYFEGCMPIEVMAARGPQTLAFGPMRPVGLDDPAGGRRPHAVVQLRREDRHGQLYNLVGFQTRLRWPEQKRVFRTLPGLARAEFARLGSVHRNTFLSAPAALAPDLSLRGRPDVWCAGQLTGVEGYAESAAVGLLAALSIADRLAGRPFEPPPTTTMVGGLLGWLRDADPAHFQPMNSNFGLLDPVAGRFRGKGARAAKRAALAERALADLDAWIAARADPRRAGRAAGGLASVP